MSLNFKESETFKKSLESLKAVCQRLSDECGYPEDYSVFNSGTTEEKLKKIETLYNISLCEEYREFMKFSNGAKIMENRINMYDIRMFGVDDPMVPAGYLTIGEIIGDGARIAISKEDGDIYSCYDGEVVYWSLSYQIDRLITQCEDEIDDYIDDVEREKRRKAGVTKEQEDLERHKRIDELCKRVDEMLKNRGVK